MELRRQHCLRLRDTHARLQASHDFNPVVVLLEVLITWLISRLNNHLGMHRQVNVRHIARFGSEEIRRNDAYDHKRPVIEANSLRHGRSRTWKMPLCETMADDSDGRIGDLIVIVQNRSEEHTSE